MEGSLGGHPWQGASAGPLLAPLGSHQCGAAVPCGWVLLADALMGSCPAAHSGNRLWQRESFV